MTISTDAPAQQSNFRRPRRPIYRRLAAGGTGAAFVGAVVAVLLTGPSTYGGGADSADTRPTPGLHGQSLAAYVADHQAARLARTP